MAFDTCDFLSSPLPPPPLLGGEGGEALNLEALSSVVAHPARASAPPLRRWRVVGRCPCCLAAWVLDIDAPEDPVASWPAPGKMTDALLCGSCQGRKRVLYRGEDGRTRSLWTKADVAAMLGNLQRNPDGFQAIVTRNRLVLENDRPPIDQIEDVLGRLRRVSVVGDKFLAACGVDWSRYIARRD